MPLTAEEYKELKALVESPDSGLDDDTRTQALTTVQQYEDKSIQGWGAAEPPAAAPAPVKDLSLSLDPNFDLMPQALAVQPATTHAQGDKAAANDWMVSGGQDAAGSVFVYEPPLAVVRKRMLEDGAFHRALFPNSPATPEEIVGMKQGDSIYQAAADKMWRDTAEAAAGSGKTAYRYSKAPWLQGGGAMGAIQTLGMKALGSVKPAAEGINSFVMGVDDTAAFGAVRAAEETANPEVQEPNDLLGIESVGGVPTTDAKTHNAMNQEDHPGAYLAGQALGALAPWGAANRLYSFVAKGGQKVAGAGANLGVRALNATGVGAISGAAVQAGQEGVDAAASMAQTGSPGTTLEQSGGRIGNAAMGAGALGGSLELLGGAAAAGADAIRHGPRFKGIPGRLEQSGVEFTTLGGPKVPKETQAVIKEANRKNVKPQDLMAQEIAPTISKVVGDDLNEALNVVKKEQEAFGQTREGKMRLPATNFVNRSVELLRNLHGKSGKGLGRLQVDGPTAKVKKIFNNEVGKVSLEPAEGAIELSIDEAEAFLSNRWKRKLVPESPAPKAAQSSSGAREVDLPGAGTAELTPAEKKTMGRLGNSRAADAAADPALKSALEKTRVDSPGTLYKGMTLDDEGLKKLTEKGELTFDNYSSAAGDKEYAAGYAATGKNKPVLVEFDGVPQAHRKSDREMLLPPGGYKISGTRTETIRIPELDRDVEVTVLKVSSSGEAAKGGGEDVTQSLRRRGVQKVYVTPMRRSALEHEGVIRGLQVKQGDDPDTMRVLKQAARQDRQPRGAAWTQLMEKHSQLLGETKQAKRLASPKGDSFQVLAGHGGQKTGELFTVEALRAAADKGGVREQLERIRNLDDLQRLRSDISLGAHSGQMERKSRLASKAAIHAFPALRALEGPVGPLRGGKGGRLGTVGEDENDKKRRQEATK